MTWLKRWGIGCIGVLLGLAIGISVSLVLQSSPFVPDELRQNAAQENSLTNPLLECRELPEPLLIAERLNLEKEIRTLIETRKKSGELGKASVYFRDLNNGPWIGVSEGDIFSPASLMKLPLAIALYAREEKEPGFLKQEFQYEGEGKDYEAGQAFGREAQLQPEAIYSMGQLIELMLKESSNEAALLLSQVAGEKSYAQVFKDFALEIPKSGADYEVTVRRYGSFFRILYNATYLSERNSQAILNILTTSSFHEGIVAGVPSGVVVAHKFGTREIAGQAGSKQLHDCGIVYAKDTPYIICIMTQGNDFAKLAEFIKEVSVLVYKNIAP